MDSVNGHLKWDLICRHFIQQCVEGGAHKPQYYNLHTRLTLNRYQAAAKQDNGQLLRVGFVFLRNVFLTFQKDPSSASQVGDSFYFLIR